MAWDIIVLRITCLLCPHFHETKFSNIITISRWPQCLVLYASLLCTKTKFYYFTLINTLSDGRKWVRIWLGLLYALEYFAMLPTMKVPEFQCPISMALCKTTLSLLRHGRYHSIVLNHRNVKPKSNPIHLWWIVFILMEFRARLPPHTPPYVTHGSIAIRRRQFTIVVTALSQSSRQALGCLQKSHMYPQSNYILICQEANSILSIRLEKKNHFKYSYNRNQSPANCMSTP